MNVLADDVEVQQVRIEELVDGISEALDCLERGLNQAPDDVSGRMAVEDARSILKEVSEDE